MNKTAAILGSICLITASLTTNAACSIDLPITELNDCIVVEGSGASYDRERDHISTETEGVEIVEYSDPNTLGNKISSRIEK